MSQPRILGNRGTLGTTSAINRMRCDGDPVSIILFTKIRLLLRCTRIQGKNTG
jgi:hypothetical protein